MKAISICVPVTGGPYSVFLTLRRALSERGIDISWIGAAHSASRRELPAATPDDLACGSVLVSCSDDAVDRARTLINHLESVRPDVIIVHSLGEPAEANLVRYLPRQMRRVLIVHNITVATYRAARSMRDHVHATVGVSPRIASDLIRSYGFPGEWTCSIPNAADLQAGLRAIRRNAVDSRLRVLSLGRVEHASKGILWLPDILKRAIRAGADLCLTIAGDGPDLGALKDRVLKAGLEQRAHFWGPVPHEQVPEIMADHDVFLFPSMYEGFGIVLAEAMAAGCVPVASRIRGVTDTIVRHGDSGLLFPIGEKTRAADHLLALWRDRDLLAAMRDACRSAARRFDLAPHGEAYAALMQRVIRTPREIAPTLPISEWRMSSYLRHGWRRWVPASMRTTLRVARERAWPI